MDGGIKEFKRKIVWEINLLVHQVMEQDEKSAWVNEKVPI